MVTRITGQTQVCPELLISLGSTTRQQRHWDFAEAETSQPLTEPRSLQRIRGSRAWLRSGVTATGIVCTAFARGWRRAGSKWLRHVPFVFKYDAAIF